MKSITIKTKDGTTQTLEGEILSVSEVQVRQGHPYLYGNGCFRYGEEGIQRISDTHINALLELSRFQAMGELPVEGKVQWTIDPIGKPEHWAEVDYKTYQLNAFFPTREAAEQALKDFGGWEHLRQVRRDIHMVGGDV